MPRFICVCLTTLLVTAFVHTATAQTRVPSQPAASARPLSDAVKRLTIHVERNMVEPRFARASDGRESVKNGAIIGAVGGGLAVGAFVGYL